MPKIRKKTSKRGTSHQRAKIKHKVAESHKKAKRDAKKNPQWKTKHKKDPGIPNNFPYKDQILAEVAEQRREVEDAKQRRKEERKAGKSVVLATIEAGPREQLVVDFDGISNVAAVKISSHSRLTKTKSQATLDHGDADDALQLLDSAFGDLKSILEKTDVVLQILDARDPISCRSSHIEEFVRKKGDGSKTILILNKIDTCPRESLRSWASHLRSQAPLFFFRSASAFLPQIEHVKKGAKEGKPKSAKDALGLEPLLNALVREAARKEGQPLIVAAVGIGNVGKSSLVNSLLRQSLCSVYSASSSSHGPSTTTNPQEAILDFKGTQIHLIDTPALSWEMPSGMDVGEMAKERANDMLLRHKGRIDKVKDPLPALTQIVSRADSEDLMLFYNLAAFAKGNESAFLSGVARSNGLLRKSGSLDLLGAARIVLQDWNSGRFPRYTNPPSTVASSAKLDDGWTDLYTGDDAILESIQTWREMRRGRGLVKMLPGNIESRQAVLEKSWDNGKSAQHEDENSPGSTEDPSKGDDFIGPDSSSDGEDGKSGDDNENSDRDEDDAKDEDNHESHLPLSGKRKRQNRKMSLAPTPKKVAFAPGTKGVKQNQVASSGTKRADSSLPATKAIKSANKKAKSPTKRPVPAESQAREEAYDFGRFF